jgi:hypothetical protein
MPSFYFFSEEQLRKLKVNDLLKLANYYHVAYTKSKPNVNRIITDILKAQKTHSFEFGFTVSDPEPQTMSVRVQRIYEQLERDKK